MSKESDHDRALKIFKAICPDSEFLEYLVIEGEPYSKARPRFNKRTGKAYSSDKQKANERILGYRMRRAISTPYTHNLAIGCIFFRSSHQRIDVDNMLKNVMDAANGIIYIDDCQVTAKLGIVELDKERPRTVIVIGRHDSTLVRDLNKKMICKTCKKEYDAASPYWNTRSKFCSRACAAHSKGQNLLSNVKCVKCNTEFKRKTAAQKYCSEECRKQVMIESNRGKRIHAKATCKECGGAVSRPEYVRCRKCWSKKGKDVSAHEEAG